MKMIKDKNGTQWEIEVNIGSLRRVKQLTGIDLLKVVTGREPLELAQDPFQFADILVALCAHQINQKKMTDESFLEGFAGDSFNDATAAFIESLIDFFPNPGVRNLLKTQWNAFSESTTKMLENATSQLERHLSQVNQQALNEISGETSSIVQESLESHLGSSRLEIS